MTRTVALPVAFCGLPVPISALLRYQTLELTLSAMRFSFYLPCIIMVGLYAKLYAICQKHVKSIKSMTKPIHVSGQTYNHHITEHKAAITLGVIMGTFLGMYHINCLIVSHKIQYT